jgi:hypothetical protein
MADLVEASQWEKGIYQLETSDPVEGGPDGVDNVQARQLGNRTRYLKDQHEAHVAADNPHPQYATLVQMKAAIEALVASAPGALDTLNELAAALGDDPNFATTVTNELALKAALDSPQFSGIPTAPTPPRFDNSTKLATMAALKAAGFQFSNTKTVSASTALDASHVGAMTIVISNPGPITLTLPTTANQPIGSVLCILNQSPYAVTLARGDSGAIAACGSPYNSVTVAPGDTALLATLASSANSNWEFFAGTALNAYSALFGASLAGTGYQKLPSGLILQWGDASFSTSQSTYNLPIAFPNFAWRIVGSPVAIGSTGFAISLVNRSQISVQSSSGSGTANYIAIGN